MCLQVETFTVLEQNILGKLKERISLKRGLRLTSLCPIAAMRAGVFQTITKQ